MFRQVATSLSRSIRLPSNTLGTFRSLSAADGSAASSAVPPEDMPFLHHGQRPRFRDYKKFKSPRKRASNLLHKLTIEKVNESKAAKPQVWETNFKVGDALEVGWSLKAGKSDKIRGVVIGITRRGLDTSVLLRDVVYGQPVERRIPLHSPLVQSIKVLEENFIYKGKRKVKRAKLYFLRDRNPLLTRVTKG